MGVRSLDKQTKWLIGGCLLAFVVLCGVVYQKTQQNQSKEAYSMEFLMNTFVEQKVYGKQGEKAVKEVVESLKEFEKIYSMHLTDSLVAEINKNAGIQPVALNAEVFRFLEKSLAYCKNSKGVFDITIAPLVNLWGVTSKQPKIPTAQEIQDTMGLVGYEKVQLDKEKQTIFLPQSGMMIDLGGIAKGEAFLRIDGIYRKYKLTSGFVSLGGNIYTYKKDVDGLPFKIGIRNPDEGGNSVVGYLNMEDEIIATSGGYERFVEVDGQKFHHIIDPKTGYPSNSDLKSVSIISKDGALSDFLSTTFFILGEEAVRKHLQEKDYAIIAITNQNEVILSEELKTKFFKE